jgi:hypothetical protein
MSVVPATYEVEIKRIYVGGQLQEKVSEIPISTNNVVEELHACNPCSAGGTGRIMAQGQPEAQR